MMDIKEILLQWFTNMLIKIRASVADKSDLGVAVKCEIISNQQLTKDLHRPITRKFEKQKVYSSFIDNRLFFNK